MQRCRHHLQVFHGHAAGIAPRDLARLVALVALSLPHALLALAGLVLGQQPLRLLQLLTQAPLLPLRIREGTPAGRGRCLRCTVSVQW